MEHAAIEKFERFEKWLIENGATFDMVCVDVFFLRYVPFRG
jgi:hypothetical protein